ncbi:MAG: DNA/RNA non-specific endonuclease [Polyangiales bacterium]
MLSARSAMRLDCHEHERPYADRDGYDEEFTGVRVPLPRLTDEAMQRVARRIDVDASEGDHVLHYHHYSVVMNRVRRFCFFAASNTAREPRLTGTRPPAPIDAPWGFDPRIARSHQVGRDELYGPAGLDERHVHLPDDGRWGATDEARHLAYGDAFHFTNATPRVRLDGSSGDLARARVERYISEQVGSVRSSVFAGPVFAPDDPAVEGVAVPQRAWEIVVVRGRTRIGAWGFVLDAGDVVRRQVSVAAIEGITEVRFADVVRDGDALRSDPDASVPIEALASIRGLR